MDTEYLDVSRTAPAVLQLRYDSTLLEKDGVVRTWRDLEVMHQPNDGSYHRWCRARRLAASRGARWRAWIVAASQDSSRAVDGGVVMVVLTTETSRWRVP